MEDYIGMIKIFAGNFAPQNWAFCYGQPLQINQYQALYSLIGTVYGGSATTFNLPDLRGRIPVGVGISSVSGNSYQLGQKQGSSVVSLSTTQLASHAHFVPQTPITGQAIFRISDQGADAISPVNQSFAQGSAPIENSGGKYPMVFDRNPSFTQGNHLHQDSITYIADPIPATATAISGGGQPFSIQNPYLALNYIICLTGIYPPRP